MCVRQRERESASLHSRCVRERIRLSRIRVGVPFTLSVRVNDGLKKDDILVLSNTIAENEPTCAML